MKRLLLVIFLFSILIKGYSQDGSLNSIHIQGFNLDKSYEGQEMRVQYYQNYRMGHDWPPTADVSSRIKDGKFDLSFVPKDSVGYVLLFSPSGIDTMMNIKIFLVEPGDEMIMNLRDKVQFSGKNAFKFQMQCDIANIVPEEIPNNNEMSFTYLSDLFAASDRSMLKRINLLNNFKRKLHPDVYNTYRLNIEADKRAYKLTTLHIIHSLSYPEDSVVARSRILEFYKYLIPNMAPFRYSDKVKLESSTYNDYLLGLEKSKIYFETASKNQKVKIDFSTLFNNVLSTYHGPVRDRLLMTLVTCWISFRDSTDMYQKKALEVITDNYSRYAILKQRNLIGKGAKVFNFKLQDTLGTYVRLSDFKGKIVVLDFYFTGCTGCATLAHNMIPVIEKFKGNPNVAFISITVDPTMKMFKNAVKSEKYTHKENTNLWTNGEGQNHELIKYYNIYGFPFLMIIDGEGKVLEGEPPYPSSTKPNLTNNFIAIIEAELAKMSKVK